MTYRHLRECMTLEEKAGLCSGGDFWHTKAVERLQIPSLMLTDGPHGLRQQTGKGDHLGVNASHPATCFPTSATVANAWDRELARKIGAAIGEEAHAAGVSVVLGPGINIKRSPLCGRNFEYFSEDPFLTGELATAYIEGMQQRGVGASLKHFAVNSQEEHRMTVDAVVDERTLREIYLTAFEMAVKAAQPWTVMSAYNKLNGTYCTENAYLLGILKEEWGYEGVVVTDWGAENDRVRGLIAGNELEMPSCNGINDRKLVAAVKSGALDEAVLDEAVDCLLHLVEKASPNLQKAYTADVAAHHALAVEGAEESVVLLKNDGNVLPLSTKNTVAVIGDMAKSPRYQGAGSSFIVPLHLENAFDAMCEEGFSPMFAQGYSREGKEPEETLIASACEMAANAAAAVVFIGLTEHQETEGQDRTDLHLPPNQEALVERLAAVNPHVIVVLAGGSPITMPWLESVQAVIHGYLGGEGSGIAIARVLSGKINPSGKLAESYPLCLEDVPCHPGTAVSTEYRESIFVGYRYYDTANISVLFPFGFGLSYTRFSYTSLYLDRRDMTDTDTLRIQCTVRNTGDRDGAEIVQLYVSPAHSVIFKANQELRDFKKVFLKAGEQTEVSFTLSRRAFAHYDVLTRDWQVESGTYHIRVGASSREILLCETVAVHAGAEQTLDYRGKADCYYDAHVHEVSDAAFVAVLGHALPVPPKEGLFDENSTLEMAQHTHWGRRIWKIVEWLLVRPALKNGDFNTALCVRIGRQTPLHAFVTMGGGIVDETAVQGIVLMLNGKGMRGFFKALKGVHPFKRQ